MDQIYNARYHQLDEEAYFKIISHKTASLFVSCVSMGAYCANVEDDRLTRIRRFAELFGLCFQIKDDVFDYFPNPQIGKPTGNDLREGKVTLPLLYALNNGPQDEAEKMKAMIVNGQLETENINTLIEFAKENGGIDYAFDVMRSMQKEADAIIDRYPDSDAKKCFREIFEFIISRDQ